MHQNSQSRTSRAELTTKDTNYKMMSSEMSAQHAQYHNQASAWHPQPTHQARNASQSSNRYGDEAHRSTHAYNPALPAQQHQLNSAIMSAKIETAQPCNQQQVMPAAAYDALDLQHPAPPVPNATNSENRHYAAHRLAAADPLKPSSKESDSNHAKYLLDGYMKSNITTD